MFDIFIQIFSWIFIPFVAKKYFLGAFWRLSALKKNPGHKSCEMFAMQGW
jgi:hypothetical protein